MFKFNIKNNLYISFIAFIYSCYTKPIQEYTGDNISFPKLSYIPEEVKSAKIDLDTNSKVLKIQGKPFYIHYNGQLAFDLNGFPSETLNAKDSFLFKENKKNSNCKIILIKSKPIKSKGKVTVHDLPSPTFYIVVKDINGKIKGGYIKKNRLVQELKNNPSLILTFSQFMEESQIKTFIRPETMKSLSEAFAAIKSKPNQQIKTPKVEVFYKKAPTFVKSWKTLSDLGTLEYDCVPVSNGGYILVKTPTRVLSWFIAPSKNPKLVSIN